MADAKITFEKCVLDSRDLGSDEKHMVSRVFFSLDIGGEVYSDLSVDIKHQLKGQDQIEIGKPFGFNGILNDDEYRDCVKRFYNSLVESRAAGLKVQSGQEPKRGYSVFFCHRQFEVPGSQKKKG